MWINSSHEELALCHNPLPCELSSNLAGHQYLFSLDVDTKICPKHHQQPPLSCKGASDQTRVLGQSCLDSQLVAAVYNTSRDTPHPRNRTAPTNNKDCVDWYS